MKTYQQMISCEDMQDWWVYNKGINQIACCQQVGRLQREINQHLSTVVDQTEKS